MDLVLRVCVIWSVRTHACKPICLVAALPWFQVETLNLVRNSGLKDRFLPKVLERPALSQPCWHAKQKPASDGAVHEDKAAGISYLQSLLPVQSNKSSSRENPSLLLQKRKLEK